MKPRFIILTCLAGLALAATASACSVPVYRYALERWPAEPYTVYVFHKGPLAGDNAKLSAWLMSCALNETAPVNVVVRDADVDAIKDPVVADVWKRQGNVTLPWLVLDYPDTYAREETVWTGPLTAANARAVVDSPARREIAQRILSGDALVWVLLEGGDAKADDAAEAFVKAEIDKLKTSLKLSEIDEADLEPGAPKPDLKVALSFLRLKRDDPAEAVFLATLTKSEDKLPDDKPVLFTIFAQGRLLWALSDTGISAENLQYIAEFVVGPCSCVVKAQNPGIDLLVSANWSALADGKWVKPQELPPLAGLSGFVPADNAPAGLSAKPPVCPVANRLSVFGFALITSIVAIVAAVVIVSIALARRRGS